jgi:hypothetical protein
MKIAAFSLYLIAATSVQGFAPQVNRGSSIIGAGFSSTALDARRTKSRKPKTRASTGSRDISETEVRALFSLWNNALATGDSRIVAKRYAKESILLPTVSDVPRTDFAGIKDYFDAFLLKQPQGQILDGDIRIGNGWAQDAGVYEFTMGGETSNLFSFEVTILQIKLTLFSSLIHSHRRSGQGPIHIHLCLRKQAMEDCSPSFFCHAREHLHLQKNHRGRSPWPFPTLELCSRHS